MTAALVPEIAGMSPEQARGALAVMAKTDPGRVQQIVDFANRTQAIQTAAQQQQFLQQQAAQQQAAEAFRQYAEQQDAKALAGETPETIASIRETIFSDAQKAGITKEQLYEAYNSVPALRHSFVQGLLADGAKWRASQRSLSAHRHNPVQKVQRPGVASEGPSSESEYASLERSLRGRELNPRQAADLLIAHRGRR